MGVRQNDIDRPPLRNASGEPRDCKDLSERYGARSLQCHSDGHPPPEPPPHARPYAPPARSATHFTEIGRIRPGRREPWARHVRPSESVI